MQNARLGAGFDISSQDLDLRGAGTLLGEEQAGHIKVIGAALYRHLFDRRDGMRHAGSGDMVTGTQYRHERPHSPELRA